MPRSARRLRPSARRKSARPGRKAQAASRKAIVGHDALGSIRIVFSASGVATARADYEPFGEAVTIAGMPTGPLPAQQFTGQERDGLERQDYFGARYYRPRHGRFSQVDPVYAGLFDPQQWNRYAYARNNPLSFVDPDGRMRVTPFCEGLDLNYARCLALTTPSGIGAADLASWQQVLRQGPTHSGPGTAGLRRRDIKDVDDDTNDSCGNDGDGDGNSTGNNSHTNRVQNTGEDNADIDAAAVTLDCFKKNFSFSFNSTNEFFFGGYTRLARTLIGMGTAGAVARQTGLTSVGMAWSDLRHGQGVANLGVRGTLVSVGANAAVNAVLSTAALEIGIVVGAALDSGVQTFVLDRCQ